MDSSQTAPMPREKDEPVSSKSGKITLKQIIEKAHDKNNRKMHDILGGGTAADVLLWRDTISSLTVIFVATELWFICSSIELLTFAKVLIGINVFLVCQYLVTSLVVLYYIPKIYKFLHHQMKATVYIFTRKLIAFELGGWYPFGTANKLIELLFPTLDTNVDRLGKLLTQIKQHKEDAGGIDWVLNPLKDYIVGLIEKSDDWFKEMLNHLCKIVDLLSKLKEAIFNSGEDQPDSLKEVIIFLIDTSIDWGKLLLFNWEFRTTIAKETAQMLITISSHPTLDDHDHRQEDKQHPMKWAIAYLEWLAISTLFFGPATVLYMGYICIAIVPALLNYWMECDSGSHDKSV
ncbi:hypothetical protein ACOSQ4_026186 [Xanthoceras sorbifolium]